jgi:diacylglycerol kinase family enzyme
MAVEIDLLPSGALHRAAVRALERGAGKDVDAIVVGGGDGSVRTVAGVLAGTAIPLGVLPLGTLNHFARDLDVPFDVERAVALIAAGRTRQVDLGHVNGEVFANNASIGFYPLLVLERERRQRRGRLSKWTAMALAAIRILRHLPLYALSVCGAGRERPVKTPVVFVGNNAYRFGPPTFGKRERLDGGELCLYVAKAQDSLALMGLAWRILAGRSGRPGDLQVLRLQSAEIRSKRHRLLVALDGEIESLRTPLRFEIRPGALRVYGTAEE